MIDINQTVRKWLESRSTLNYVLVALILFIMLSVKYFLPEYDVNEAGKLVGVRQLVEPNYLSHDWAVATGHGDNIFDVAFNVMLAPLWLLLKNLLWTALLARAIFWTGFLWVSIRLCRRLELEPYVLLLGMGGWLLLKQCLCTSEWILGGIEPKCFSYAFLLLALVAIFNKRMFKAGICCGVAIGFHLQVGFWGSLALGAALIAMQREVGWRNVCKFAASTLLLSLPLLWMALRYDAASTAADRQEAARLTVFFVDPLHLDPTYFHGYFFFAVLMGITVASCWLYHRIVPAFEARIISGFLIALALEFGSGLVVWQLHEYRLLLSFPFRTADTLVLFFFMLGLSCWIGREFFHWCDSVVWKRSPQALNMVCIVLILAICAISAVKIKMRSEEFSKRWLSHLDSRDNKWREMTAWIRNQTPLDAVFLAPPWINNFWTDAERAEVVNFKRAPHNTQMIEWKQRLEATNGGAFKERCYAARDELKLHYPFLSVQQIHANGERYGASYFLTLQACPEMKDELVHENGAYFLYRLSGHSGQKQ